MANRLGALHGGATATIFDDLTSGVLAIVAKKDFWQFSGVSRTLTVNYLKPVFVAEVIIVEAEIVDIGQRLCKRCSSPSVIKLTKSRPVEGNHEEK